MIRLGGFRGRLVVTFVALVALVALVLGLGSYLFVDRSLRDRLVREAVAQAEFNIAVLAPERLPDRPTREDFEASGLDEAFRLRGAETYVELADGDAFASRFAFRSTPTIVSPELRELVAAGRLGYEWTRVGGLSYLAAAGRLPPEGPDFYFFFPASDVETALLRLREALFAGGVLLVTLAALTGGVVARRVVRPIEQGSRAARRVAGGDLSARVPVETHDELGAWAASFNQMAAALEEKINELEDAYTRQRRFVADVSHELRTPLTALVNEALMLRRHVAYLGPEQRRLGEMLVADVTRLRGLVEDLMEISRFDAAAEQAEWSDFELPRFVEAVVAERLPGARLRMDPEVGVVNSDRQRLERILGNLLDNARRHAADADVEVTVGASDGLIRLSVADHGPGVAREELPRIFERFYKSDPSRRGDGSGLGLAIARENARLLGGNLTARLRPEGGMVFELLLPAGDSRGEPEPLEEDR